MSPSFKLSRVWGSSPESAVLALYSEDARARGEDLSVLCLREAGGLRVVREEAAHISAGWASPTGRVYCVANERLLEYANGAWSESEQPKLLGAQQLSGVAHDDGDELFAVTYEHLLHRSPAGDWAAHELPKENLESPNRVVGLGADALFIVGAPEPDSARPTGVLRWDGASFHPMDAPDDEFFGAAVTADGALYVAGEQLHRWAETDGWHVFEDGPARYTVGLTAFEGAVHAATREGVYRVVDGKALEQIHPTRANNLSVLGDALFAKFLGGAPPMFWRDGAWTEFEIGALLGS